MIDQAESVIEAKEEDYQEIGESVRILPKKMQLKIASGDYPLTNSKGHLCVNIPLFELENLYGRIHQLQRAVKKKRR